MSNQIGLFIKKILLGKKNNLISLDEPYEVMRRLLKGHDVTGVIDAGASNGRISKRLLGKFPAADAYAFEPNRLYFDTLQQYSKENPRFHPFFLGLSDHEGSADLHITRSPGNTSLLMPGKNLKEIDPEGSDVERSENIQIATIDGWAEHNGNLTIQLMKFDIQGGELKALRGATRMLQDSTLLVYTEIWFNCPYEGGAIYSEIDLFLRKYGFVLYDIYKPKYNSNGQILWANAIFLNPERVGI